MLGVHEGRWAAVGSAHRIGEHLNKMMRTEVWKNDPDEGGQVALVEGAVVAGSAVVVGGVPIEGGPGGNKYAK